MGVEAAEFAFPFAFAVNVDRFAFGVLGFEAGVATVEDVVSAEVEHGDAAAVKFGCKSLGGECIDLVGEQRVIKAGFDATDSGAVDHPVGIGLQGKSGDGIEFGEVELLAGDGGDLMVG